MTYHAKIIAGGKIVIPADIRRELNLIDGDTMVVEREGEVVTLKPRAQVLREIQASVRAQLKQAVSVDDLIAQRRSESKAG